MAKETVPLGTTKSIKVTTNIKKDFFILQSSLVGNRLSATR